MQKMSWRAKLYIWITWLLGGLLMAWYIANLHAEPVWLLVAVCLLAGLAHIFRVKGATQNSSYEISWVLYGFVFVVLGAPAAILAIVAAYAAEYIWHKEKWFIVLFNVKSFVIAVALASLAQQYVQQGAEIWAWQGIAGILAAATVFTLLNHLQIGLVLWLASGETLKQSGVMGRLPLMIDFTTFGLGAAAALFWMVNPLAVVLVATPLYLIYSTLQVPALQRQTQLDPKTGLYNARYFNEVLEKELSRADRFNRPVTVVIADMDLLRNINNTYGHIAGDAALLGVANILKRMVREYDVVARFGGEEFAILMPETWPQKALQRVEAIRSAIEVAAFEVSTSPTPIKVTMSFGVAGREGAGETPKDIVHHADVAVYRAKLTGRNRVCYFNYGDVLSIQDALRLPVPEPVEDLIGTLRAAAEPPPPAAAQPAPSPVTPIGTPPAVSAPAVLAAPAAPALVAPSLPAKASRPRWWLQAYLASLIVVATGLFAWISPQAVAPDWVGLGLFTLLVLVTEWLALDIYVRETSVSTSVVPFISGLLLFGPVGGLVLSLVLALTALLKHHSPMSRFLFNSSNHVISGMLAIGLLQALGWPYASQPLLVQLLMTTVVTGLAYVCNTGLIALAIYLDSGQPVLPTWSERFSWLWPYYLAFGIVAFALGWMYLENGQLGVVIMLVPLFMLRFSQGEYLRRTKHTVSQLKAANSELTQRAEHVAKLNEDLIQALSRVVDLRDPYVQSHSQHVARYAVLMAEALGLPAERVELVRKAGLLHDIGKLGIPEAILFKPGKLTADEYRTIQEHAAIGADMIQHVQALRGLMPFIRHHHEHFDGRGYPDRLREHAIPLEARILSVADAVEAMASDRPYRAGLDSQTILNELRRNMGTQFDPEVVRAFEQVVAQLGIDLIINSAHQVHSRVSDEAHPRHVPGAVRNTGSLPALSGTD